jgi:hypothetical protein
MSTRIASFHFYYLPCFYDLECIGEGLLTLGLYRIYCSTMDREVKSLEKLVIVHENQRSLKGKITVTVSRSGCNVCIKLPTNQYYDRNSSTL